jgi:TetR/AcrR family transcriptional regulator, transcriptional repressor for nem operon
MSQLQPSTAREPSTAKGQSTRARIVQAAAELVAEKGAAGMSLDDVGERAHASRSQLTTTSTTATI